MSDLAGREILFCYRQPQERIRRWLHVAEEVDAFRQWGDGFRAGDAFNRVHRTAIGSYLRLNATPRRLFADSPCAHDAMAEGYEEKDDAKDRSSLPSALHMSAASAHEDHFRSRWRTCRNCWIDRLRQ